ncbi:family 16 glycosylhydrolase [Oscillochloris sp. ZM17-4]|uniref:glycoside hydrolase family 16 protein n=1 Tax=Oscillochloris sp. ZM17-4 TaxID=2866714 RepID=UPI001C72A014|nr:glycoside hydrolase family 16 protein [Oscillochloris sp. ZM17-4]MBX0328361.1 family 16 glycosylhydrolase [Oscillochloris sp. ZM17-4]
MPPHHTHRAPGTPSRRATIAALLLLLLISVGACAAAGPAADGWTLTWSDEFDGPAGAGVDTGADGWIYDLGHGYGCPGCPDNWGTGEIETMSDSTANVSHDGAGALAITPIRSGSPGAYTWTSGRIETQRADFQADVGGRLAIEARIKLPDVTGAAAQGYWPAFWALGAPFRGVYTNWPGIGEIDIMENVGGANSWWATLHCGTAPGGPCYETDGLGSGEVTGWSPSLQSDYHTYRVELDRSTSPEEIRWSVDGVQKHTVKASQVDATTWASATDHGFFIILNVAIGGGWPGPPTDMTASGVPMLVDYVRVYNR